MNRRENPVLTELRSRSTRVRGRELQGERKIKKLMACPGWHLGLRTLAGQATWQGSCRDEALAVGGAGSILGAPGTELSKTQLETGVRKLCGSAATLGINTLPLSDLPPPPPHEVPTVGTAAALGWSGACAGWKRGSKRSEPGEGWGGTANGEQSSCQRGWTESQEEGQAGGDTGGMQGQAVQRGGVRPRGEQQNRDKSWEPATPGPARPAVAQHFVDGHGVGTIPWGHEGSGAHV